MMCLHHLLHLLHHFLLSQHRRNTRTSSTRSCWPSCSTARSTRSRTRSYSAMASCRAVSSSCARLPPARRKRSPWTRSSRSCAVGYYPPPNVRRQRLSALFCFGLPTHPNQSSINRVLQLCQVKREKNLTAHANFKRCA